MSGEDGGGANRPIFLKYREAIPYSQCSNYSPDFEQFAVMPFFHDGVDEAFTEAVSTKLYLLYLFSTFMLNESNISYRIYKASVIIFKANL